MRRSTMARTAWSSAFSHTTREADEEGGLSRVLSPCIEWLFADGGRPFSERVHVAAAAGFTRIEFWTVRGRDVTELERAIRKTHVTVTAFVSEPTGQLVDPSTHAEFLAGVERSSALASRLNAKNLIVVSGDARRGIDEKLQHDAIASALRLAAPIASQAGIGLLLEPLNSRVDHQGHYLDSTVEALALIREVNHPAVRLLYDMYHSIVMDEDPGQVLSGAGALVGHVHIADVPGRHEPGTGGVDWTRQLVALGSAGYSGPLGLEYMPSRETESSLTFIRDVVEGEEA